MSDEGGVTSGGETEDGRRSGGRTAVVTKPATRPQRPASKRSRQRVSVSDTGVDVKVEELSVEAEVVKESKAKKPKKPADRSANPIVFIYNYLKQAVAEMRKVIWPNRKQMLNYTSVVLVFLVFMVALVGFADFGLAKLVLLVFG
ncbi:preprotein translocase subunit SecE [Mycobacterium uberis]|uniref:Protein translocase subunit SecE n=1 Tax=Mycobacterium uberis TaxID=2162698 RepID=A0A3E1HII8_9MYCO|nr:preprotein translocase subunit SecE [Mycobacterium uberis]RFD26256.1 preprotein translocase subunit SecE [Mycobacterium uberis]